MNLNRQSLAASVVALAGFLAGAHVHPAFADPGDVTDRGGNDKANTYIRKGGASTLQQGIVKTITRGVNLDGTDFGGQNLKGVAFQQSIVRQANFKGANLYSASFFDATLDNSDFEDAGTCVLATIVSLGSCCLLLFPWFDFLLYGLFVDYCRPHAGQRGVGAVQRGQLQEHGGAGDVRGGHDAVRRHQVHREQRLDRHRAPQGASMVHVDVHLRLLCEPVSTLSFGRTNASTSAACPAPLAPTPRRAWTRGSRCGAWIECVCVGLPSTCACCCSSSCLLPTFSKKYVQRPEARKRRRSRLKGS